MSELKPEDKKLHEAIRKAMDYDEFYDTILEAAQARKIKQLQADNEKYSDICEGLHKDCAEFQAELEKLKEFIESTDNAEAYSQWCTCNKPADLPEK